jgi:peptidoglycan/xylan/chitin deacetylase (PgdA/CDA1 family)
MNKRVWIAAALYYLGIVHLAGAVQRLLGRGRALVLMGHRVLPAEAAADAVDRMALLSGHAITPQEMERRLRFVQRHLRSAGDPVDLRAGPPARGAFYLTFDDGYADNVTHAQPVLARLGVRALIFFVADLVRNPTACPWWDRWGGEMLAKGGRLRDAVAAYGRRCAHAKRRYSGLSSEDLAPTATRRYLGADELRALPETFYAGNHSRSHADLSALDARTFVEHVRDGDAALQSHPRYLPVLAYPFGTHDARSVEQARRSGLCTIAFATGGGVDDDPFRLRRVNLNVAPFPLFAAQCAGLLR